MFVPTKKKRERKVSGGRNETAARRRERTGRQAGKIRRERETRETSRAKPEELAKRRVRRKRISPSSGHLSTKRCRVNVGRMFREIKHVFT